VLALYRAALPTRCQWILLSSASRCSSRLSGRGSSYEEMKSCSYLVRKASSAIAASARTASRPPPRAYSRRSASSFSAMRSTAPSVDLCLYAITGCSLCQSCP
jgi:hypothetical protein